MFYTFLIQTSSGFQVAFLLFLFFVIIAGAYYMTYYIARFQQGVKQQSNLQIIEAISAGPSKSIQIVRMGKRYAVVAVTRNHVELLTMLDEDDLMIKDHNQKPSSLSFKDVLEKYKHRKEKASGELHENNVQERDVDKEEV